MHPFLYWLTWVFESHKPSLYLKEKLEHLQPGESNLSLLFSSCPYPHAVSST